MGGFSTMQIVKLRCDAMVNPIGFAFDSPRLSWEVASAGRSERQSAYRLQIALDESFAAPLLDERVESDESVNVPLTLALAPRTRYFWRVKIWNGAGEESPWAEPAYFETAKMDEPWRAQWIRSPENEGFPALRRAFQLENKPIRRARAYACGVGLYHLYLNGEKVGDEELTPNFNPYNHYLQYQTYDITSLLRPGENAVGALLGNGYYKGRVSWPNMPRCTCLYGNELALIAELVVDYADGTQQTIVTDETWKAGRSPLLRAEIYDGEVYDARLELPGWNAPGFDDSHWLSTAHAGVDAALLQPRRSVPVRVVEERPAVQVLRTPKGEDVVDFGQNCAGWVRLSLNAPAGVEIRVQYGEMLDKDGNFYRENMRTALAEMVYTTREGEQSYAPLFTFFGFRYIRVTGWPGALSPEQFTQCVVHSDLERTGEFECSDARVNRLFENVIWGQRSNFVDVPTDCPQRDERMGWTGDAQVFAATGCINMLSDAFYRKYLHDVACEQSEVGYVPNVTPNFLKRVGQCHAPTTGWGDVATVVPWMLYLYYGDTVVLEKQYDSMKAWVDYMRAQDKDGSDLYGGFHLGDWLAQDTRNPDSLFGATPTGLLATAYYAYSAEIVSKAAKVLGKEEDARFYASLARRVREAFRREYVSPNGRLTADTQTGPVIALKMDMLDPAHRPRAVRALEERLKIDNFHLTTGFLGTPHLCPILSENGLNEYAYQLLLNTGFPSWLYAVERGATTVWERWNSIREDGSMGEVSMNSFNHYAYGSIAEWMYRYVAGLNPVESEPGFKRSRVAPMPNSMLAYARASIHTQYGLLACGWKLEGDAIEIDIDIPFNTTADILLPDADGVEIWENGSPMYSFSFARGSGHWHYAYKPNRRTIDKRVPKK